MKIVVKYNPKIVYLICGSGELSNKLMNLIKDLKLEENVKILGYRNDVKEILKITNCFIFPSLQEGLPVAMLEAMVAGNPIICSDIRGNRDLVTDGKGGYIVKEQSIKDYARCILDIANDTVKQKEYGIYNRERVKKFDKKEVEHRMTKVYSDLINKN